MIKNNLKKIFARINRKFDVLLLLLLGLLPLTWFRGKIIAGGDFTFPIADPEVLLKESISMWNPTLALGIRSSTFRLLPYTLTNCLLRKIGFNAMHMDILLFVFWFTGAGLSTYCLIMTIFKGERIKATLGALFYMFNPYSMVVRWYELNFWQFFYAFMPLVLAFFIRIIRTKRLIDIFKFLLATLLLSLSFGNIGSLILMLIVLGVYFSFYLLINLKRINEVKSAIFLLLIVFLLFFAVHAWWILPTLGSWKQEATMRETPDTIEERLSFTSRKSSFINVIRLKGYCWTDLTYGGTNDPAIPYMKSYENNIHNILSWSIPVMALIGIIYIKKYKDIKWLAILWGIFSFFMKGTQPPLGNITKWLIMKIPILWLFRHPFDKFGMLAVIGISPLVGLGIAKTGYVLGSIFKGKEISKVMEWLTILIISIVMFILLAWPFWTGELIYPGGETMPSYRIKEIPRSYREAREWIASQKESFRILTLPYTRSSWALGLYNWCMGYDPTPWIFGKSALTPSNYPGGELCEAAAQSIVRGQRNLSEILCDILNVRYIILRKDSNWQILGIDNIYCRNYGYIYKPYQYMLDILKNQEWLKCVGDFESFILFENRGWRENHVTTANEVRYIDKMEFNLVEQSSDWATFNGARVERSGETIILSFTENEDEKQYAGVMKEICGIDAPFLKYSYTMQVANSVNAHIVVHWLDDNGNVIEDQLLQAGITGTSVGKEFQGLLPRPDESKRCRILILAIPQNGTEVRINGLKIEEEYFTAALQALRNEEKYVKEHQSFMDCKGFVFIDKETRMFPMVKENKCNEQESANVMIEKESPWKIKIHLEAESPCFLVLNEYFDEGWQLYKGTASILNFVTGTSKLPFDHVKVNKYANGWYIDMPGSYELILYYQPQVLLYIGMAISLLSLAILFYVIIAKK